MRLAAADAIAGRRGRHLQRGRTWVRYVFDWSPLPRGSSWGRWIVDDQITVLYNFGENLVNSAVFNTTDRLRGQGSAPKNIADWVSGLRPGAVGRWASTRSITGSHFRRGCTRRIRRSPMSRGNFRDLVVGASDILADVQRDLGHLGADQGGVDGLVGFSSNILDAISWVPSSR